MKFEIGFSEDNFIESSCDDIEVMGTLQGFEVCYRIKIINPNYLDIPSAPFPMFVKVDGVIFGPLVFDKKGCIYEGHYYSKKIPKRNYKTEAYKFNTQLFEEVYKNKIMKEQIFKPGDKVYYYDFSAKQCKKVNLIILERELDKIERLWRTTEISHVNLPYKYQPTLVKESALSFTPYDLVNGGFSQQRPIDFSILNEADWFYVVTKEDNYFYFKGNMFEKNDANKCFNVDHNYKDVGKSLCLKKEVKTLRKCNAEELEKIKKIFPEEFIKPGQLVWVRDYDLKDYVLAHFKCFKNGKINVTHKGYPSETDYIYNYYSINCPYDLDQPCFKKS